MQLVGPVIDGAKGSVDGAVFSGTGGGGRALLVKIVSKLIGQKYT